MQSPEAFILFLSKYIRYSKEIRKQIIDMKYLRIWHTGTSMNWDLPIGFNCETKSIKSLLVKKTILCDVPYEYYDKNNGDIFIIFMSFQKIGGYVSTRKPADYKPLLIFGQDECISKQYIFCKKSWIDHKIKQFGYLKKMVKDWCSLLL